MMRSVALSSESSSVETPAIAAVMISTMTAVTAQAYQGAALYQGRFGGSAPNGGSSGVEVGVGVVDTRPKAEWNRLWSRPVCLPAACAFYYDSVALATKNTSNLLDSLKSHVVRGSHDCRRAPHHDASAASDTSIFPARRRCRRRSSSSSGGVDLKTAQARLGHSNPRLTLALYAQATEAGDRAAAVALRDRFLGARRTERGIDAG